MRRALERRSCTPAHSLQLLGIDDMTGEPVYADEYDSEEDSDYETEESDEDDDLGELLRCSRRRRGGRGCTGARRAAVMRLGASGGRAPSAEHSPPTHAPR